MKTMKPYKIILIGGGASGLFLATTLLQKGERADEMLLIERGERLGRKLSATGNGQGNVTNLAVKEGGFFTSPTQRARAQAMVNAHDNDELTAFFSRLGIPLLPDDRGRVYPAGKQASALTDGLRFAIETLPVRFNEQAIALEKKGEVFEVTTQTPTGTQTYYGEKIILCTGGKAAKNFGTDGSAYALAQTFGHSVTPLYPSLVQLKTDVTYTKTLKGIRVNDGKLTAELSGETVALQGDIIFTEYGVSGDAVFRISAYLTDKIADGVTLFIDFLPELTEEKLSALLLQKRKAYPHLPTNELLFGILNNQIGRAIFRRAEGELAKAVALIKRFPLQVTGSLGFDYAQVTKGGLPLCEVDDHLQSRFVQGLYFTGEILDVDGACGGYNLQWAYSSAQTVAEGILSK